MKKLLLMIVIGTVIIIISSQAKAQMASNSSTKISAAEVRKEKFQALSRLMDSLRKEEAPLHEKMKEEMDKIKQLREQLMALREEHRKVIDEERAKLGLPALPHPKAIGKPTQSLLNTPIENDKK